MHAQTNFQFLNEKIWSKMSYRKKKISFTKYKTQHQQLVIQREIDKFKDIIQVDFIDSYFNKTNKTMNGMKSIEYRI